MTDQEYQDWLDSPFARKTVLVQVGVNVNDVETTFYLSNRGYTSNTHQVYDPCVTGGVSFTEELSLDGTPSVGYGDITIANMSGEKDDWVLPSHVWASRPISVFIGDPQWPIADFRKIFEGVVNDVASATKNSIAITLLNKLDRLNNPATETKLGGSTANSDRVIPVTLGEVHNMEPLLISTDQDYKVHGASIEDIIEVRDNGAPRTDITKNLSTGSFRISGNAVIGQVTVSVQGDKSSGVYYNDVANLTKILVKNYGPVALRFTDADIDLVNFAAFAASHTQPVGITFNDTTGVLSAAQSLAASVGAQITCSSLGKLRLVKLGLPVLSTPIDVTPDDIIKDSLTITDRPPVKGAVKLAYCKNYTVQTSGLATGLNPNSADLFAQEWLTSTAKNSGVLAKYRIREEPSQEDTLLLVKSHAETETNRRLSLWSTARTVFSLTGKPKYLTLELGDAIRLTHPRFGLSGSKTGLLIRIRRDWLAGRVELGVLV